MSSAIAVASFLPQVVERSAQGSFVLLLAGVGGLVPDTLDFRLARFLRRPDVEIDVDADGAAPGGLDAQVVAERLGAAIELAHRTGSPTYVRLGTIKLGADLWQRYSVRFDEGQVQVRVGPPVDGAQSPVDAVERRGRTHSDVRAAVAVPMWQGASMRRGAAVVVDVFSGTALEFRPREAGIEIVFLPWHRRWSHSLTLAVLIGGSVALLLGPLFGLAYVLGSLTHILEDQLGFMGSNLLYPFTRRRTGGLGLFHSGDALPNLFAVWLSAVLLLLNLDRFSSFPVFDPWRLLFVGFVAPWALIGALWWWSRHRRQARRGNDGVLERQADVRQAAVLVDVSQDGERASSQGGRMPAEDDSGDG